MAKKVEKFECDDKYEAEKLAGLLTIQKDNGRNSSDVKTTILFFSS